MAGSSWSSLRVAIVLAGAMALVSTLLAAPASAASPTACRVRNVDTGVTRSSLQAAVTAARPGHELTVRGTCHGLTVVSKSLSIRGMRTATSGRPTLDGGELGTVVTVKSGVTVAITDLTIRNGHGPGRPGGGVINEGTLRLRGSSSIRGNDETGVHNVGLLRMDDSSSIRFNRGGHTGGGVYNDGTLVLRARSSIRRNSSQDSSGGVWNVGGIVKLMGSSSISGNTCGLGGGGVSNSGGTVKLMDSSSIWGNTAGGSGGGIANSGTVTMSGSSAIWGNTAGGSGGGIVYDDGATLVGVICAPAAHANVHDNTPDDCQMLVGP